MKKIIISIFTAIALSGCNDFIDLKPVDFPTEETFYTDVKGLEGAIIGIYDELQSSDQYGSKFMTLMEVRGDNVKNDNSGASGGITYQIEVFTETPANSNLSGAWLSLYKTIYRCNLVLQNMEKVQMTEEQRTQIAGQASFVRALCYFNLVRLWGEVPIITKTQTVAEARNNKRSPVSEVYDLLAKVYLYMKNYQEVINELTSVVADINAKRNLSLVPMPQTFPNNLKTSKDIIFAVQYLKGGVGESVHQNNRYRNNDNGNIISLEQAEFENNDDNRKALVAPTGSGQRPGKFDAPATNNETSADFPVMRCAEVMLMYAEAANELSAIPTQEALDALNAVRINANLMGKTLEELSTKEIFRQAVYKERRLELALECDRWFDIVRTGQMTTVFPGIAAYRQLYPIPQTEIENVSDKDGWQNEGYTVE